MKRNSGWLLIILACMASACGDDPVNTPVDSGAGDTGVVTDVGNPTTDRPDAGSPVDTGPTPRIGARVRVAVGGEALEGTVIRVGHGEATLEMAECPAGAPVIDRRQRLVGFCIEGGDGDIMLTNAVDELATAVAHDLEPADTTPPTEPDTTTADTTGG